MACGLGRVSSLQKIKGSLDCMGDPWHVDFRPRLTQAEGCGNLSINLVLGNSLSVFDSGDRLSPSGDHGLMSR
jgi:hypothetical protein